MTRQTMSEDISQLALALSKFQGEMPSVLKGKTANIGQYKYKYADLADIFKSILTTLSEYELSIVQFFTDEDSRSYIVTTLMHSSGQWIKSYLKVAHHEKIQQLGSEITYLRRYALSSILGIAAEDDDDGAKANESERKESPVNVLPKCVSKNQLQDIEDLLVMVEDSSYLDNVLKYHKISDIKYIPSEKFAVTMTSIRKKINDEEHKRIKDKEESESNIA